MAKTAREEKSMTLRQLRDALVALPPEALDRPATWWGEERGGYIARLDVLEQDWYSTGEGCEPADVFTEEERSEMDLAHPKGAAILMVDDFT